MIVEEDRGAAAATSADDVALGDDEELAIIGEAGEASALLEMPEW